MKKTLLLLAAMAICGGDRPAVASTPSAAAMTRLLESGRVPADRRVSVARRIVDRGDAEDLAGVLKLATSDAMTDADRIVVLEAMAEATKTRKVKPKGDLSSFGMLLESESEELRSAAIPLAGLWNIDTATDELKEIVGNADASQRMRNAALDALMSLDKSAAKDAVLAMTAADQPLAVRQRGLARLASIDVEAAAPLATELLGKLDGSADPLPLVEPFLSQQRGPRTLARAMQDVTLTEDQAKNILSKLSAIGSADADLTRAILQAANLSGEGRQWEDTKIVEVAGMIESQGDPANGEQVFRRESLNCFKCHQVNKAGGNIGPELSAVGVTSPNDYLIRALIYPSKDIKEAWQTRLVRTDDGRVLSGIVVSEDDDLLKLKDAQGKIIDIPTDDIDAEKEGDSLMPAGLTKFLTDKEFIDLVAYLKALGTPNSDYAVRSTPRIQKYEFLNSGSNGYQQSIPGGNKLAKLHQSKAWEPFYAMTNGDVPLEELRRKIGGRKVVYLRAEVDTDEPVSARLMPGYGKDGVVMFANSTLMETTAVPSAQLKPGRNRITIRIDTEDRQSDTFSLELQPQDGGSVRPVDGA